MMYLYVLKMKPLNNKHSTLELDEISHEKIWTIKNKDVKQLELDDEPLWLKIWNH